MREQRYLPQPHGAAAAAAGQQFAIRAERHHEHALGAGLEGRADGLAGGRVPQPHGAVAVGAGQQLAVGLNATQVTRYWALVTWRVLPTGRPVVGFHSRTMPSPSPVASSLPLGLNATP